MAKKLEENSPEQVEEPTFVEPQLPVGGSAPGSDYAASTPSGIIRDPNVTAWAVVSFVLGLSSLFFWFGLNAVAAVIAGHVVLKKLKVHPYDKQNKIFSIIGLVSGYVGIAIVCFSVIVAIASVILMAIALWFLTIFGMMAGR